MRNSLKEIIDKIKSSKSFLITAHVSLEGDALGSELATYALLRRLKKRAVVCNNDHTPPIYKFLPHSGVIRNVLKEDKFDVAMVLDCSDSSRTGRVKDYLARAKCIINIDHHISNTYFGDINWVDPKASSACQILYGLCDKMKIMDKNIALCLYTGIFTDTGNFTYTNTTKETHKIVANLMHYGVSPRLIYENVHSLCEDKDLKLIGRIISNLKFDASRKICWAVISKWEDKDYDLTEVIFSVMRLLKNVEVLILFKKVDKNKIRVNFRSRPTVDVNRIAQFFGGGGHKSASGTTIEGEIAQAEKKVISFVKRYTNKLK
ncbi:MAG: bifunctional oligoribonuclease/PAP phosphatase NrnA [Candidatus Omnitrophica bacterium]|nr:bifunctional oligoribonuclease/PAP phosphatase NrnA [Candidatus Omnitrophota bacterium]